MKNLFVLFVLMLSFKTQAGIIKLDISNNKLTTGDSLTIDIIASNFLPTDAFNFDLIFDSSLFNYDESSFTSDLFISNPLAMVFDVNAYDNRIGFSFLDFDPIVATDFVLASIELTALNAGKSDFYFYNVAFYQPFSLTPMVMDSNDIAQVEVTQVPEPSSWLLLPLALFTLVSSKHKNSVNK